MYWARKASCGVQFLPDRGEGVAAKGQLQQAAASLASKRPGGTLPAKDTKKKVTLDLTRSKADKADTDDAVSGTAAWVVLGACMCQQIIARATDMVA
jgi:hypothetical protein